LRCFSSCSSPVPVGFVLCFRVLSNTRKMTAARTVISATAKSRYSGNDER
jgi:hypothetical protein